MSENSNTLTIYSDTKSLVEVDVFLKRILNEHGISENVYNRFYLCVSEAVINAIVHGNHNDNSKVVTISTKIENDFARVKIRDEGRGFDIKNLLDPTCSENIRKEHGRGLFIIKTYSDELSFQDKGSVIEFKLKLSGKHRISS